MLRAGIVAGHRHCVGPAQTQEVNPCLQNTLVRCWFVYVQELRTSYPMRSIRPLTPLADAANSAEQQLRKQQQQQRRPASTGRVRPRQQQQHPNSMYGLSGSDQSLPPAIERLFVDAAVRMQRAEKYKQVTYQAERKARSWSAPRCEACGGAWSTCCSSKVSASQLVL